MVDFVVHRIKNSQYDMYTSKAKNFYCDSFRICCANKLGLSRKTQNVKGWVICESPFKSWVKGRCLNWLPVLPLLFILDYLDFISSDSVQYMICAISRIHNGLKIVFCFMHATSDFDDYADLLTCIEHILWNILEAYVNACWVYSCECV